MDFARQCKIKRVTKLPRKKLFNDDEARIKTEEPRKVPIVQPLKSQVAELIREHQLETLKVTKGRLTMKKTVMNQPPHIVGRDGGGLFSSGRRSEPVTRRLSSRPASPISLAYLRQKARREGDLLAFLKTANTNLEMKSHAELQDEKKAVRSRKNRQHPHRLFHDHRKQFIECQKEKSETNRVRHGKGTGEEAVSPHHNLESPLAIPLSTTPSQQPVQGDIGAIDGAEEDLVFHPAQEELLANILLELSKIQIEVFPQDEPLNTKLCRKLGHVFAAHHDGMTIPEFFALRKSATNQQKQTQNEEGTMSGWYETRMVRTPEGHPLIERDKHWPPQTTEHNSILEGLNRSEDMLHLPFPVEEISNHRNASDDQSSNFFPLF